MSDYESNPSVEEENSSEQKGYIDTEGNEKCQKEKKAQIAFLKERDEKRKNAKASYQAYITKITEYVASHDADCTSGTATSTSRSETCSNARLGEDGGDIEEISSEGAGDPTSEE
ncbi:hypothetical protein IM40_03370 [Candidatus Paracaedimonas acanthamoebae]|nr:hypothetical protein IM40_03370 [Candidatus Paracaedimonas acanthamoebae]